MSRPASAGAHAFWSPAEDKIIRQFYPLEGRKKCLARLPRRSMKSLIHRARFLGVKVNPEVVDQLRQCGVVNASSPSWSEHEDAVLRTFYPTGGVAAVAGRLPNRTRDAIYLRCSRLGLQTKGECFGDIVSRAIAGMEPDAPPPARGARREAIKVVDKIVQEWTAQRAVPRINSIAGTLYDFRLFQQ